ncbi:hypothetical protein H7H82_05535 [Mycobacterium heidelbergense]|uniref:Uncharacterized protein n=1 Tax=Mycobacterium heidelbergense TaxID=53376 RepID=A0A1X0DW11_MYCHE|nr:hypothetical protein [Mycobacterium heidelbergense]MCV7050065.1 hypothetical protein [Mycobacterium heidelbergense]ORA76537.1 hypothetical protein BST25_00150 [Mycobacterium heidelbergense]BBZ51753.1 hypothetical protein MHEI_34700 [Mycobacterium heidelbergense]
MDLAARPHITAGIALASAAVLAAGPMAQHLPDLHATQHLREVSVPGIQLTDAADSVIDLFSGVENELASLASGAAATAVPAAALTDFINPAALPLPIATWVKTFQNVGTSLQTTVNLMQKLPFPVAQQVAANWVSYADVYVNAYQVAANAAVKFYTGTATTNFWPYLNAAFNSFASGSFTGLNKGVVPDLVEAFYAYPLLTIGLPLGTILHIPADFTQNLATVTTYLLENSVTSIGTYWASTLPTQVETAFGGSFQAASTAWSHGDPVGAISNLLNTPGALVNDFLNGSTGSQGLISFLLNHTILTTLTPNLATSIVAPNAQNIASGGSLQAALQGLGNQLINGWPSLSNAVSGISTGLTTLLQNVASKMPSLLASFGATFATNIGLLISNLLKLL